MKKFSLMIVLVVSICLLPIVYCPFPPVGQACTPRRNLRLFESIGNLTGMAFDRILLYEEALAKSSEIQQRNRELDDFAYVVSHDLKEPLITIEGYSKILNADYADRLGEEGQKYLNSIVQSGDRMKRLIEDLLTLARIGRAAEEQEQIPLADLLEEVVRDFEFALTQRNARIEYPKDLPVVRYNRTYLGMVFRNLISNGLKFNTNPSTPSPVNADKESRS